MSTSVICLFSPVRPEFCIWLYQSLLVLSCFFWFFFFNFGLYAFPENIFVVYCSERSFYAGLTSAISSEVLACFNTHLKNLASQFDFFLTEKKWLFDSHSSFPLNCRKVCHMNCCHGSGCILGNALENVGYGWGASGICVCSWYQDVVAQSVYISK